MNVRVEVEAAFGVRATVEVNDPIASSDGERTKAREKALLLEAVSRIYSALHPEDTWEPRA